MELADNAGAPPAGRVLEVRVIFRVGPSALLVGQERGSTGDIDGHAARKEDARTREEPMETRGVKMPWPAGTQVSSLPLDAVNLCPFHLV